MLSITKDGRCSAKCIGRSRGGYVRRHFVLRLLDKMGAQLMKGGNRAKKPM